MTKMTLMTSSLLFIMMAVQVIHLVDGECGAQGEPDCPRGYPPTDPPTLAPTDPPTDAPTDAPTTVTPTTPAVIKDFKCGWTMRGYGYMVHRNVETVNYYTATALCAKFGATLPQYNIRTIKDRRRVMRKMKITQNFFHFGMTDEEVESEWRWLDGSIVDQNILGWHEGEPNNMDTENCAISWYKINPRFFYTVNDLPCDYETHYGDHVWRIGGQEYRFKPVVMCEKKCP